MNIERCLCGLGNKIRNLVDNNVHIYIYKRQGYKPFLILKMPKHEGGCLSDEC